MYFAIKKEMEDDSIQHFKITENPWWYSSKWHFLTVTAFIINNCLISDAFDFIVLEIKMIVYFKSVYT